jgi:hypothetical protein
MCAACVQRVTTATHRRAGERGFVGRSASNARRQLSYFIFCGMDASIGKLNELLAAHYEQIVETLANARDGSVDDDESMPLTLRKSSSSNKSRFAGVCVCVCVCVCVFIDERL